MFSDLKRFWNYRNVVPKLYNNISNIHTAVKRIQKVILLSVSAVMVTYWLRPVVNGKIRFIFYYCIPIQSILLETILLFVQYYFVIIIVPVIFSCDSLYMSFSAHVISQLRLLNYKLMNMKTNVDNQEIYECIKHHQLMLS